MKSAAIMSQTKRRLWAKIDFFLSLDFLVWLHFKQSNNVCLLNITVNKQLKEKKRFISQWLYTMHERGLRNMKSIEYVWNSKFSNVIRAKVNRKRRWQNPKVSERRITTYRFSMTANQNGIFKSSVSRLATGRHRFSQNGIKYLKNISQPSRFRHIIGQQERWNRHLLEGSYKTTGHGAGQGRNVMFQLESL